MGGPNTALRGLRQRQPSRINPGEPLGRQELADLVNAHVEAATDRPGALDANYIGKLERGVISWPGRHYRAGLREVLGVGTDRELGLTRSRHTAPEGGTVAVPYQIRNVRGSDTVIGLSFESQELRRRDLLRTLSVAGILIALPSGGIAGSDQSDCPNKVDAADLDDYEQLNSHLWQVYSLSTSKRTVYPLVRQQLESLTATLERSHSDASHKRLCTLTGDLFQLAGEIFFDSNRYTDAAHCYTLAASASKEASAFDLWACAVTRHAFVSLYEHNFPATVPMLDAASKLAERGNRQLSTRHWVAAVQAEVFAGLHDVDACTRALDTAETVQGLNGNGQIHNGGWLRFDGSRLAEQRGACYARLGRYDLAEIALTDALAQRLSGRRRGAVLTDLALLGVHRGDVDRILSYGYAALELAHSTDSGWIGRKLRSVQVELAPFVSDSRIADLDDQITTLNQIHRK